LGEDRELETEARRLASLVEVAQDEAVMQGREFGLEFMTASYRFVEYDPLTSLWGELFVDDLFRQRELPEDVEFELFLEGQPVLLELDAAEIDELDEDSPVRDATQTYAPHVLIFSSGDVTPFELMITRGLGDHSIVLEGNLLGQIEIATEED
jgi:general secretion pathway protein H